MTGSLSENKVKVQALIEKGQKDEAVTLLHKMAVACARAKQFRQAEKLRQQIMAVDSMALTEIINTAEVIEAEKAQAIDQGHRQTWAPIYETLTDEEASEFYFSLKKISLPADKLILQQGRVNNRLFFLDSGVLRALFEKNNDMMFIKDIHPREPVGYSSFFSISYATLTVITRGPVRLHYIDRAAWDELEDKVPGLGNKIEILCNQLVKEKIEDILARKSVERRRYPRYRLSGKAAIHLAESGGQLSKIPLQVILEDISQGGVAFSFHRATKEEARMFLGRQAMIRIQIKGQQSPMVMTGRIISVQDQLFNEYMVNFKFLNLLPYGSFMKIINP